MAVLTAPLSLSKLIQGTYFCRPCHPRCLLYRCRDPLASPSSSSSSSSSLSEFVDLCPRCATHLGPFLESHSILLQLVVVRYYPQLFYKAESILEHRPPAKYDIQAWGKRRIKVLRVLREVLEYYQEEEEEEERALETIRTAVRLVKWPFEWELEDRLRRLLAEQWANEELDRGGYVGLAPEECQIGDVEDYEEEKEGSVQDEYNGSDSDLDDASSDNDSSDDSEEKVKEGKKCRVILYE